MKDVKTALVLSAGGLFGAYQAGVWDVLAGVFRPDVVVGASVGALNGWAIAGGASAQELRQTWMDARIGQLMRIRVPWLPWKGIFDPRPLEENLREWFPSYSPVTPFAATMVELPRLRLKLVRGEEMTWRHLMASCAVPGGFPPVRIDGSLCVDGGLLGALPLWAAAEMGASRAIAADALPLMPSRLIRGFVRVIRWLSGGPPQAANLECLKVAPSRPLGSLEDSMRWNRQHIQDWIELGQTDAKALLKTAQFAAFIGGIV